MTYGCGSYACLSCYPFQYACADYYGLPVAPEDVTQYWVDYNTAELDNPIFWYIVFDESIRVILGEPTKFEVTIEE